LSVNIGTYRPRPPLYAAPSHSLCHVYICTIYPRDHQPKRPSAVYANKNTSVYDGVYTIGEEVGPPGITGTYWNRQSMTHPLIHSMITVLINDPRVHQASCSSSASGADR
jgi:hypothetical protein